MDVSTAAIESDLGSIVGPFWRVIRTGSTGKRLGFARRKIAATNMAYAIPPNAGINENLGRGNAEEHPILTRARPGKHKGKAEREKKRSYQRRYPHAEIAAMPAVPAAPALMTIAVLGALAGMQGLKV